MRSLILLFVFVAISGQLALAEDNSITEAQFPGAYNMAQHLCENVTAHYGKPHENTKSKEEIGQMNRCMSIALHSNWPEITLFDVPMNVCGAYAVRLEQESSKFRGVAAHCYLEAEKHLGYIDTHMQIDPQHSAIDYAEVETQNFVLLRVVAVDNGFTCPKNSDTCKGNNLVH